MSRHICFDLLNLKRCTLGGYHIEMSPDIMLTHRRKILSGEITLRRLLRTILFYRKMISEEVDHPVEGYPREGYYVGAVGHFRTRVIQS